jgi:hypothetical protein
MAAAVVERQLAALLVLVERVAVVMEPLAVVLRETLGQRILAVEQEEGIQELLVAVAA